MDNATQEAPKVEEVKVPEGHIAATFHFRTETLRDENGDAIGKGKKHPDVKMFLPVPSDVELVNFLAAGGKEAQFLKELVNEAVKLAARGQINDWREENKEGTVTPAVFDLTKLTFSAIAAMEKADRASDIPDEVFATFYEDYKTVMTALGTPAEKIAKHVALFKNQFRVARYDKPALGILQERLNMYAAKTENMEDNADVYGLLTGKIVKYLKADEKKLVEAL